MSEAIWVAIISGFLGVGGAVAGAVIGSKISRKSSFDAVESSNKNAVAIMKDQEFIVASARLRAAFAPAQSKMITDFYSAGRKLRDFFYEELGVHAAAVEMFRPFASDGASYQKAWDEYQKTINHERGTNNEEWPWTSNVFETGEGIHPPNFTGVINEKIKSILHFASPD